MMMIKSQNEKSLQQNSQPVNGFTLLEVIFAIILLTLGIMPLLGIESATINRLYRNNNEVYATLLARDMMSLIESSPTWTLDNWDSTRPASELLSQMSQRINGGAYIHPLESEIASYSMHLVISPLELQGVPPGSVIKISLEVSWSDNPLDKVSFNYIRPIVKIS
jgi:hypothetical protein